MIRPTAVQLEHLWSTASSLDLFERILMKEDPHAFLSSNLCWPFWASELQTAFFDIGVVANPGLASDSESNKYLSAIWDLTRRVSLFFIMFTVELLKYSRCPLRF